MIFDGQACGGPIDCVSASAAHIDAVRDLVGGAAQAGGVFKEKVESAVS
jgi:hypothetical protein